MEQKLGTEINYFRLFHKSITRICYEDQINLRFYIVKFLFSNIQTKFQRVLLIEMQLNPYEAYKDNRRQSNSTSSSLKLDIQY